MLASLCRAAFMEATDASRLVCRRGFVSRILTHTPDHGGVRVRTEFSVNAARVSQAPGRVGSVANFPYPQNAQIAEHLEHLERLEHLECSHQPHIQGRGAEKRTQRAG